MLPLLLAAESGGWPTFCQHVLNGLTTGSLFALIALGYTMVYGVIGLINFAHGDLFMLGSMLAYTLIGWLALTTAAAGGAVFGIVLLIVASAAMCAGLNYSIEKLVYKPLRNAPKLAPLVSAIGLSFVFQNIGLLWGGAADLDFPDLVSDRNLLGASELRFTPKDLMIVTVVIPIMIGLTVLVKYTALGKAMRAVAQNPTAAQLMGIDVDRVISFTFLLGGALAGAASVMYGIYIDTIGYQMGYLNGLYAFTAAVLGGIGNIPGAVLGGLVIGQVRALGTGYLEERWSGALVFAILIAILVFRPTGLLGTAAREKV